MYVEENMNVKNCRGCGRLFNYITGPFLCPGCREGMEAKFQKVKEYIREHPGVGIQQVSADCEVETSQINQWLREERLELTEGSPLMLTCMSCGELIRSGKYCEKCKNNLTNGFRNVMRGQQPVADNSVVKKNKDNRMRYLDR